MVLFQSSDNVYQVLLERPNRLILLPSACECEKPATSAEENYAASRLNVAYYKQVRAFLNSKYSVQNITVEAHNVSLLL